MQTGPAGSVNDGHPVAVRVEVGVEPGGEPFKDVSSGGRGVCDSELDGGVHVHGIDFGCNQGHDGNAVQFNAQGVAGNKARCRGGGRGGGKQGGREKAGEQGAAWHFEVLDRCKTRSWRPAAWISG